MKSKVPIALLFAWLALSLAPQPHTNAATAPRADLAPSSDSGTLQGTVSNAATTLFLEGARVEILNRGLLVLTDRDGRYRIANAPAGEVTLVISYTGLDTARIPVHVVPGQVSFQDVELSSSIYRMDAVVVSDVREGNALAITQQRNAPNVKNIAATDAFGNIADGNAAEMLRLLPGMAAENTESESRFMMVRGIDANLNSVTFDGMKLASGGSGAERRTGMSEIPLGTVEYMEVTKSPTPDLDGDSIGGSINMRPANVFDRKNPRRITYAFSISGRATGSSPGAGAYTHRRYRPTASLGYSDVFGARQNLGLTLNLSHTVNWVPMGGMIQAVWQQPATGPDFMSGTTPIR